MKVKLLLTLLVICLAVNIQFVVGQDEIIVLADGGLILEEPIKAEGRLMLLELTLSIENGQNVERITGSILHPYSSGPFDVQTAASDIVKSASISTFDTHINFVVELGDQVPKEKETLFTAKPIFEYINEGWGYTREGGLIGSYPFEIQWMAKEITFRPQYTAPVIFVADPVVRSTDMVGNISVRTMGFIATVQSVTIKQINGVNLYPGIQLSNQGEGVFENRFTTIEGVAYPYMPLTFEVVLEDGTRYLLHDEHQSTQVILSPPAGVVDWDLHI